MNGAPMPARPSAPTPFKKLRRPILGRDCPVGDAKPVDVDELVCDRAWVTESCRCLGFIGTDFPSVGSERQDSKLLRIRHDRATFESRRCEVQLCYAPNTCRDTAPNPESPPDFHRALWRLNPESYRSCSKGRYRAHRLSKCGRLGPSDPCRRR